MDLRRFADRRSPPHDRRRPSRAVELSGHTDDNVAVASIEALGSLGGTEALACLLATRPFRQLLPQLRRDRRAGEVGRFAGGRDPALRHRRSSAWARGGSRPRAPGRRDLRSRSSSRWLASSQVVQQVAIAAVALAEIHERREAAATAPVLALSRAVAHYPQKDTFEARLERALAGAGRRGEGSHRQPCSGSFLRVRRWSPCWRCSESRATPRRSPPARSVGWRSWATWRWSTLRFTSRASERTLLLARARAVCRRAVPWFVQCLERSGDARASAGLRRSRQDGRSVVRAGALFAARGCRSFRSTRRPPRRSSRSARPKPKRSRSRQPSPGRSQRRHAALRIISYFGSLRALPVLLDATKGDDERSREIALAGLATIENGGRAGRNPCWHAARLGKNPRGRGAAHSATSRRAPKSWRGLVETRRTIPTPGCATTPVSRSGIPATRASRTTLSARLLDPAGQVRVVRYRRHRPLAGAPALAVLEARDWSTRISRYVAQR